MNRSMMQKLFVKSMFPMKFEELKTFLDEKADQYNHSGCIEKDRSSSPHRCGLKRDIDISRLLTATISWGDRKSRLNSAEKMLGFMDHSPYDLVLNVSEKYLKSLEGIPVHRTFNGEDF